MGKLGAIQYALFAYLMTAVISFFIVGVIVLVNNLMVRNDNGKGGESK